MEFEFKVEDADLSKLAELFADVNIKETPWFDVSDKYGNSARYYREGQWIPCSERLPEDGEEVFVYLFCRQSPYIAWVEDSHWYTEDFEIESGEEPAAWMPLPEPWKGEEE